MQILGFNISRGITASVPAPKPDTVSTKPSVPLKQAFPTQDIGDTGTRTRNGYIYEEYNSQLSGVEGVRVFDEMRRSDATVKAAMTACTLPIRRANFFINAVSPDPKDVEVSQFVNKALFEWLDQSWDDVLRQALLMLPYGVMAFEKVYGTMESDGKTYVTVRKLGPRLPRSIQSWQLNDGTFGVRQIRQDGNIAEIPGSKLLVFVNEREGENWWGTSMLRAAYKHWYYKDRFYKIDAVAFERQGLGVPMMKMPAGYTKSDENKAKTAMQNLRANESAYLLVPDGYEAEFMDMKAGTTRTPTESIAHHNRQILMSVLAQFLDLGSSQVGSKALSQDQSELFLMALEAVAQTIVGEINKNLIPELVNYNFDGVTVYPKLDYAGITRKDVQGLSTAYTALTNAGAIKPTYEDEQYLRNILGLPERDKSQNDDADDQGDHIDADPEDAPPEGTGKPTDKGAKDATKKKPAKEQAHEHGPNCKRARTFASKTRGKTFMSWRPLTFAEKKVDFKSLQDLMDKLEGDLGAQALDILTVAKDQFMRKLQDAVDKGDASAVAKLRLEFLNEYKNAIKRALESAYNTGKLGVSDEMKIPAAQTSAQALANIDLVASNVASKAVSDIEALAKHLSAQSLKTDVPTLQDMGRIDKALSEAIQKTIDNNVPMLIGQSVNDGRNDTFESNRGMIYGLQRSEVLDDVTCNFCLSMDGLVVEPTDTAWAKAGVFHNNCRGIWVEIMKDEQNVEDIEITGVPANLADYYDGAANTVSQPPRPIVRPDSPAKDYLDSQD